MTIKKTAPRAVIASSFGEKIGYIDPKGEFKERVDSEGTKYLVFTLLVFAMVDEYFGEVKRREFEVWAQGEDVKTLQAAFPNGAGGATKEEAVAIVAVADEWYGNYKNEQKNWVHVIGLRAASVTLPNAVTPSDTAS
ncbi:hypothetical protein ACIRL2_46675 [Embleya sp. NPDC127516]|uniref:hypothetical protein n=1 Tax=Embleya sp. NPDC127516 TaxID=3363990 RepID=UPI00380EFC1E